MPHVLVAGRLHSSGRAVLDAAPGVTVHYVEEVSEESYAPFVADADAILIRTQPLSATTVEKAGRLRIVSRHGVGYDAVDLAALNARGIALAVCGDVNSISVAEHAAMLILSAAKRSIRADRAVRTGAWEWRNLLQAQDLRGCNFLQIGFGRIGRQICAIMRGFGMHLRAYDPLLAEQGWPDSEVAKVDDLRQALGWADVVSVSVPGTGTPLLGAAEFEAMRPGAIIVNTARGGVLDESALVAALSSGRIAAAGLDVFDNEPLPKDHPLARFDQVVLSPHIAGLTDGAAERMAIASARNILDFFAGRIAPELVVNRMEIGFEAAP
jgi:D-3-phosphoglycerate dehydrogenase